MHHDHRNDECKYLIDAHAEKRLQKPDARKNVLLIVKEALNNIAKYSDASQAQVQISLEGQALFVGISDNGKGFEVADAHGGNGLYNMKQRAEALGGSYSVVSTKEKGTAIQCRIPLANISDR